MRVGLDARHDADQQAAARRRARSSRSTSSTLSITTVPTPASSGQLAARPRTSRCRAGRCRPGSKPARRARCSSPPEATSHAEALLGEDAQHRGAREGLGGEHHLAGAVVDLGQRARELARPGTQVVLGHDVGGRPELARELERVAAADAEHAVRDRGVTRVHGRAGYLRALARDGGRRGPGAAAHQPDPQAAAGHHHDREDLRLGEAEQHVVVAADELDQEALGAGEDQVDRRTASPAASGGASATAARRRGPSRASRRPASGGPPRWSAPFRPDRPSPTARPRRSP